MKEKITFDQKLEACKLIPDIQDSAKADCINSLIEVRPKYDYVDMPAYGITCFLVIGLFVFIYFITK